MLLRLSWILGARYSFATLFLTHMKVVRRIGDSEWGYSGHFNSSLWDKPPNTGQTSKSFLYLKEWSGWTADYFNSTAQASKST